MKGKKYSWERDRQSYLLTEGERKMQFICYLSFVKFGFIKFRVGTKVYFKIYVSYIESWHKDSHIPTTKSITEHDSCVRSPWHVAAQPHPLPHRLRGNHCAEFTADICQAPLMSIAREERVGRSEYLSLGIQKLQKMWFQVSSPSGGETDMSTMVVVWGRMEKYFARGLNAGKAQKRDIIPAAVSRGCSMDKVAFLPLKGGEDFYRWKERSDVTVRKEAEGARWSGEWLLHSGWLRMQGAGGSRSYNQDESKVWRESFGKWKFF